MTHYHLLNADRRMLACFSPKAACTTLKYRFSRSLSPPDPDQSRAVNRHKINHRQMAEYEDFHRVLFVRDPFSRLVGYYCKFVVCGVGSPWTHADEDKNYSVLGKTFAEFVAVAHELDRSAIVLQHHLQSQTVNVSNIAFDAVIPVERLDRDLPILNARLGFQCPVPRLNATVRSDEILELAFDEPPATLLAQGMPRPQFFYNREIASLAEEIYAADIEYYEARFGPSIVRASWPSS